MSLIQDIETTIAHNNAVIEAERIRTKGGYAVFDRYDICEAHYILEVDYNVNGVLLERPSNSRRRMSTEWQLHRMGFRPRPSLEYQTLSENGQAIYNAAVSRYHLPT